jgi:diguanylate cyclase (GGDEF)-like protein/PAS domain S-box-containing protein
MKSNNKNRPDRGTRKKEPSAHTTIQLEALQTKIHETEDRFQIIFDNSPDGMVIINPTENAEGPWLIENCNLSFCEMNGFDRSELIGKDIRMVSKETAAEVELSNKAHEKITGGPGEGKTHRREYYQRLKQGPIKIEEIHKRKDGSTFYIQSSSCLMTLSGQERVLGMDREITEHKRVEQALHDSEERYQSLFKDSPTALWEEDYSKVKQQIDHLQKRRVKDLGKYFIQHPESVAQWATLVKIVDVNQAALDLYQAGSKEELLTGFNTIFMDEALPIFIEEIIALSEGKIRFEGEFIGQTLKGDRITVAVKLSVPPGFEETWSKVFVSTIDITERKRSEEALHESEEKFRNLFNNAQVGAFRMRPDGSEILEINEKFLEILGRTRAEIQGSASVLYWADPREREEIERRLEAEDRVVDFECRMLNKQGQIRRCLMSMQYYRAQGILEGSILDITERNRNELIQNAIYRITQTAITSEGIDALYHSIHSILGELIPAENFFIALYDSANGLIIFPYYIDQYDEPPPAPTQIRGLTGYVIRTGRPLLATREIYDRLIQQGEVEALGTAGVDWLGVPLKVGGRMIGVMAVQSYTQGIHYHQEDMDLLEFVSTQVAQAIERKRLEEEIRSLSLTDDLTGLYNRRGFTLLAEQEVKLAHRKKRAMMLFFGDVDGLKTINDTLGHAYGDLALKEVSAILKETFREADILARIGGDEFVVLALDASMESSEILADRIQALLEARNQQGAETYHLSLSLGVAPYNPEAPCAVSELIAQADNLMYSQKQARKGKK